ncbi:MAG TPA: hypothetical protein VK053_22575 [Jiangellaceae bacterium]|nr:hypothetical protein [Jiangellaceae bacterium]
MASLISLFALLLTGSLVWLIVGPPIIERSADLDTLDELRKDHR